MVVEQILLPERIVVPLISENSIQRVQDSCDIVDVVESYGVKLKRSGSSFLAVCPFHNEKTPSFNVNPQLQIFKCFGCGVGGGVIKFVQLMERCEFPEAVEKLASRAGITLDYEGGSSGSGSERTRAKKDRKQALFWACRQAFDYFRAALADVSEGKAAREYLLSRGFKEETISGWGLGWAPEAWDGLLKSYLHKVVQLSGEHKVDQAREVGLEAGIFRKNDDTGRVYDAFRGRVVFPIFDLQQRPIGFGARVLVEKPESGGKYLNTSETPLFMKRSLLFGLNFAAKEIGLTKTAFVVEGYTDTIMCHQYGIRNVVATLGTSLTVEHIRLLKRYIHSDGKVVALFDNDNAGKKATRRAIELFMEEDVNLWVLSSLEVKDAGEFLPKFGAEKFREFLASARESFAFVVEEELGNKDYSGDAGGKAAAIERVMELVNRCPNSIRRNIMRSKVAEVSGINVDLLPLPAEHKGRYGDTSGYRAAGSKRAHKKDMGNYKTGESEGTPLILNARKQARVKAEKRLLQYMLADRDWCLHICDEYPPDEWYEEIEHRCAVAIRDAWLNTTDKEIRLERLIAQVSDERVKSLFLDFVDFDNTAPAAVSANNDETLNSAELEDLLLHIRVDELKERRTEINAEYARAELSGNAGLADKLLLEKLELEKQIRGIGAID